MITNIIFFFIYYRFWFFSLYFSFWYHHRPLRKYFNEILFFTLHLHDIIYFYSYSYYCYVRRKKVVIHVPYKVKNVKHTHTIYKIIPHHEEKNEHEQSHEHENYDFYRRWIIIGELYPRRKSKEWLLNSTNFYFNILTPNVPVILFK